MVIVNKTKRIFDTNKYNEYVKEFIKISEDMDKTISYSNLRFYNLPDGRWFVNHCPDKSVDSWGKFVAWCGFYSHNSTTKEQVINLVLKKSRKFNRPLMYDDFRGHGCYHVHINTVKKYWKNM
jgi:hypothetical protein